MSDPYLGEIMIVAFSYAPRNWALCNGQTIAISQNQALFALLGTTYGGDGVRTFMLPNLRARIPVHRGTLDALTVTLGEVGGSGAVTLQASQLPPHTHLVKADNGNGAVASPINAYFAAMAPSTGAAVNAYAPTSTTTLIPATIDPAGGNAPHSNVQPVLGLNYIIALAGVFPSRN